MKKLVNGFVVEFALSQDAHQPTPCPLLDHWMIMSVECNQFYNKLADKKSEKQDTSVGSDKTEPVTIDSSVLSREPHKAAIHVYETVADTNICAALVETKVDV